MPGKAIELTEDNLSFIRIIGQYMPGGFFIYEADETEKLIYENNAVIRLFGCKDREEFLALTGGTFRGMVHPDDYEEISQSVVDQIHLNNDRMDHVEYRIVRKDGEVRWIDDYGHYVETKPTGAVYVVFI